MTTLQLTLTKQPCPLQNITLYEPVDPLLLDRLIDSSLLKESFNNIYVPFPNEKKQLIAYRNNLSNSKVAVKYVRNDDYGRVYPEKSLGLHSIRREIRHTLAKGKFYDIDIENAHPCFLYQICKQHNIKCKLLEHYVNNRDSYLKKIMNHYKTDKDGAKGFFIKIMYGSSMAKWKSSNKIDTSIEDLPFTKEFKKEFENISNEIVKANTEIYEFAKSKRKESGKQYHNGVTVSYFLQEYECRVLSAMFMYLNDNNYIKQDVCVLCADGIMVNEETFKSTLMQEFHDLIIQKIGFDLKFVVKEMSQGYSSKQIQDSILYDIITPTLTTSLIASIFRLLFGHEFVYVNGKLYFYNEVYWQFDNEDNILHKRIDKQFHDKLIFKITDVIRQCTLDTTDENKSASEDYMKRAKERLKAISCLKNSSYRKQVVEDICRYLTNNDIKFDSNPHLFAFTNNVYDLSIGQFKQPVYSDYISQTCCYEYSSFYPTSRVENLHKLLDTIFPNPKVKDHKLTIASTGLYGQLIEGLFVDTGAGGNGKSLLNSLLLKTFGEYGYKLPSEVLLKPISGGANPQVANINNKRFILAQEPDSNKKIVSSTIKELTGDTQINARGLYSSDCVVNIKSTFVIEANSIPNIDEVNDAVLRRLNGNIIPFISKFVSKSVYDETTDKNNLYIGNPYYKTDEFQDEYKQAMFMILAEYFIKFRQNNYNFPTPPRECFDQSKSFLMRSDNIYDWFSEFYEADENSYVYVSDVYKLFTSSTYYANLSKSDKRKYNAKYFLEKVGENLFLKQHLKQRDNYFNKIKLKKPFLCGFREIEQDDEDEE